MKDELSKQGIFTCHLDCGIESFEHHHPYPDGDRTVVVPEKLRHIDEAYTRGIIFGLNAAISVIKEHIKKYDHP